MQYAYDVFRKFYADLVASLPMSDAIFLETLSANGLLPGNLSTEIKALHINGEKACCFLDCTIGPSLRIGDNGTLMKLLKILQESDYDYIRNLGHRIIRELMEKSNTAGKHLLDKHRIILNVNVSICSLANLL